jgi:hypothetical protein
MISAAINKKTSNALSYSNTLIQLKGHTLDGCSSLSHLISILSSLFQVRDSACTNLGYVYHQHTCGGARVSIQLQKADPQLISKVTPWIDVHHSLT